MKATELRIGNYLSGASSPVRVTKIFNEDNVGIGSGDPYCVFSETPCLSPIPLTEEWLLKFGFGKSDEEKSIIGQTIKIFSNEVNYDITVCEGHICFQFPSIWNGEIEIQYVHQLQNLYFALTGNELTLTPAKEEMK